jgi:hypothetical protein
MSTTQLIASSRDERWPFAKGKESETFQAISGQICRSCCSVAIDGLLRREFSHHRVTRNIPNTPRRNKNRPRVSPEAVLLTHLY